MLHGEAADLSAKIAANSHYDAAVADPLDPVTFVNKINVPVFMACQWEDEQTGGHCPELVRHFTGTTQKWFTFTNGAHIDSLDPDTYNRWYDFLELFVAHQAPIENVAVTDAAAPVIYQTAMGLPQTDVVTLPADPIQLIPTYSAALAAFEQLPQRPGAVRQRRRRVADAGRRTRATPIPGSSRSFSSFPVPGTTARTWYFGPAGVLGDTPPTSGGINSFTANANALPLTDYGTNTGTGGLWGNASQWQWNWQQNPSGTAVSYVSAPLTANTTVIGSGAVDLWVRSSTPDVDLQATISEVRPDGNETFVQNGWIRASERKLSTDSNNMFKQPSTALEPIPTFTAADASPMPAGQFVKVVVPLYYEGHAYRAGSRIRVTISAPNGTQPVWSFGQTVPNGTGTRLDRLLHVDAVEPRPSGRSRRDRADGAPGVPEPAQRAVPAVPGDRELVARVLATEIGDGAFGRLADVTIELDGVHRGSDHPELRDVFGSQTLLQRRDRGLDAALLTRRAWELQLRSLLRAQRHRDRGELLGAHRRERDVAQDVPV